MSARTPQGCIVKVWLRTEDGLPNRPAFLVIQTDLPDFAAFCQAADEGRFISGVLLWTKKIGFGQMLITSRQPTAIRGSDIVRTEIPLFTYTDEAPE
jgi:hypothetical protein